MAHLLGHGIEMDLMENEDDSNMDLDDRLGKGLNGTKLARETFNNVHAAMEDAGVSEEKRRETKVGVLVFWSDAFLRSFVKQKDNSVWILTVTFCPPVGEYSFNWYTQTLAIGKSGEDHSKVFEWYMEELKEIKKGQMYYNGTTNKFERLAFDLLIELADRPERQDLSDTRKEVRNCTNNLLESDESNLNTNTSIQHFCREIMVGAVDGRSILRNPFLHLVQLATRK